MGGTTVGGVGYAAAIVVGSEDWAKAGPDGDQAPGILHGGFVKDKTDFTPATHVKLPTAVFSRFSEEYEGAEAKAIAAFLARSDKVEGAERVAREVLESRCRSTTSSSEGKKEAVASACKDCNLVSDFVLRLGSTVPVDEVKAFYASVLNSGDVASSLSTFESLIITSTTTLSSSVAALESILQVVSSPACPASKVATTRNLPALATKLFSATCAPLSDVEAAVSVLSKILDELEDSPLETLAYLNVIQIKAPPVFTPLLAKLVSQPKTLTLLTKLRAVSSDPHPLTVEGYSKSLRAYAYGGCLKALPSSAYTAKDGPWVEEVAQRVSEEVAGRDWDMIEEKKEADKEKK